MIASLPMYLRPENQTAHDHFWKLIRDGLAPKGIDAPARLDAGVDLDFWKRDDLVLSQTCGMPYRLFLHGKVQLVGTPDYGLEGCPAGYYNSAIITNIKDDRTDIAEFSTANMAVNSNISQSGYAAPQNEAKKLGFQFENITMSGGHLNSAKMVATGQAEIAAIDGVTLQNITRYDDIARNIKVLTTTTPTPGLPYICALGLDRNAIAQTVSDAIDALTPEDRASLGIKSLIPIPSADYLAVENP